MEKINYLVKMGDMKIFTIMKINLKKKTFTNDKNVKPGYGGWNLALKNMPFS